MQISPFSNNLILSNRRTHQEFSFGNNKYFPKKDYSIGEKALVATTTALGVATSVAALAKKAKYPANPLKMFKNFKNSYLGKVKYEWPEVIAIGAGSCLGGLAGGYIIDKNKENRRLKNREALMHFGNIAIPIFTVGMLIDNVFKNSNKTTKCIAGLTGIVAGIYFANIVMNILCNFLFQDSSKTRGVEVTDLPAHLDDAVVATGYISDHKIVKTLGRFIPLALMVAGNEVGTKTIYD